MATNAAETEMVNVQFRLPKRLVKKLKHRAIEDGVRTNKIAEESLSVWLDGPRQAGVPDVSQSPG